MRRGRAAAVAGSALLACALVGGVGYTVVTVQDADRDPGKPTWKFSAQDQQGAKDAKTRGGPALRELFLPFGVNGYERGPDLAEFGADAEFSGQQATALRKESVKDLPSSTRRKVERLIDREHIRGMAMRSYLVRVGNEFDDNLFTVDLTLSRMENRRTVRDMSESFTSFLAATDVFRKGPKVKGHENARCFLTPKSHDKHPVDGVFCSAYQGDILVNATVSGPGPVDAQAVAAFLAAQLDRIDDPGQAV
ncbi:hypothetical protein [Streptomyces sp. NPDC003697]